ncbi:hypothetical protein ABXN37_11950 [Piscinibacter sakaiensis]|uniref:hypothetical protein n=1 Tax=Piscinibacter sakaiensis TaxID=1547922 RepID=UPI0037269443
MNRRVLGSNVQWVDRGDELLTAAGALRSDMLAQVQAAGPTMLRYPGGLQSDVFHWAAASNEHVFTRATQPTLMSPQRLLELCEATGAEPLFTVNTITGTPDEAAAWVRQANVTRGVSTRTGRTLPRVDFWELGNEPYLKEALRPDLDREPEAWAAQVDATVRAMRAVDPTIRIGLPLSTERRNGFPVTAYPRFSQRVLATLGVGIDYVCTHAGFLPLQAGASTAATELATLAAALAVQDELAALRALLSSLRPGQAWPLAVTEYAPMLGQGATDPWMLSGAGALYLADLLRVLAATPEVLAAHHWSLSGNGNFGAIAPGGYARPAGLVMGLAQQALRGELLALGVEADSVATPSARRDAAAGGAGQPRRGRAAPVAGAQGPQPARRAEPRPGRLGAAHGLADGAVDADRAHRQRPARGPAAQQHDADAGRAHDADAATGLSAQPARRARCRSRRGRGHGHGHGHGAAGRFDEARLARVRELGLAGLRYPGGLQSDTYRWQAGMGPLEARGSNEHAHSRRRQPTLMGTLEFLELCELTGAEPLLTANLVTGSAEEAAGWVRAVNVDGLRSRRSGRPLPPVRHWELGNEPYLKPDERPDLWLAPAEFARRAPPTPACASACRSRRHGAAASPARPTRTSCRPSTARWPAASTGSRCTWATCPSSGRARRRARTSTSARWPAPRRCGPTSRPSAASWRRCGRACRCRRSG